MTATREIRWYRPFVGDVFGGMGRSLTVPCRLRVTIRNVAVESVVVGPYCVEQGAVFAPGPDAGETVSDHGPGQVGC